MPYPSGFSTSTTGDFLTSLTERQWQPTLESHDPNPPITLEGHPTEIMMVAAVAMALCSYAQPASVRVDHAKLYERQQARIMTPWPSFNPVLAPPIVDAQRNNSVAVPKRAQDSFRSMQQTSPNAGWHQAVFNEIARDWAANRPESSYSVPARSIKIFDTEPNAGWVTANLSTFDPATNAAMQAELLSFRQWERARQLRLGVHDTDPNDGWLYPVVAATVAQNWPAQQQELLSFRSPERQSDKTYLRQDEPQTTPSFDSTTNTWEAYLFPPIDGQQRSSFRADARARLRLGIHDTDPNDGWIYQPVSTSVAAYAPAFAQQASSFRLAENETSVESRYYLEQVPRFPTPWPQFDGQYWPGIFPEAASYAAPARASAAIPTTTIWPVVAPVTFDAATIVSAFDKPFRVADRAKLRVGLHDTDPNDGWQQPVVDAYTAQYQPAAELRGYRSADRAIDRTFIRQDSPENGWLYPASTANVAPYWPGIELELRSFRASERVQDRTFILQGQPEIGWIEEEEEAQEAQFYPAIALELSGFRTIDRASDRVYLQQTAPEFGWIYAPVTSDNATFWPAIESNTQRSYRATRINTAIQTATNDGWIFGEEDFQEEQFSPAFILEASSVRAPARVVDRTYLLQQQPQPNYYSATTPFEAPLYVPSVQLASSFRSLAGPRLILGVHDTQPEIAYIFPVTDAQAAIYWPGIEEALGRSFRFVKVYTAIPTTPNDGWQYTPVSATVAATWPSIEQGTDRSFRAADRKSEKRFTLNTQPNDGWTEEEEEFVEAQYAGIWQQEVNGFRSADRISDKTFILQGQPEPAWYTANFVFYDATLFPPNTQIASSFRAADGKKLRLGVHDTDPNDGWIYQPVGSSIAATWPGIEEMLRSFRAEDAKKDKTLLQQTTPEIGWINSASDADLARFFAAQTVSYRQPTRITEPRLALSTAPNPGFIFAEEDAQEAKYWPAIEQGLARNFVSPKRSTLVFNTQPNDIYTSASNAIASYWPGIEEGGDYRAADRKLERRLTLTTSPNDGWSEEEAEAVEAQYACVWALELSSFRAKDRVTDKTFIRQTTPEPNYYSVTTPFEVQFQVPADAQTRNAGYRAPDRDQRVIRTTVNPGWEFGPATAALASYAAIWQQEANGFRTPDSTRDRFYVEQTQPEPNFYSATTPFEFNTYASIADATRNSYRSLARSTDVRPTITEDGWLTTAVNSDLARFWSAQQSSFRVEDRKREAIDTSPIQVYQVYEIKTYAAIYAQQSAPQPWVRKSAAIDTQPETILRFTEWLIPYFAATNAQQVSYRVEKRADAAIQTQPEYVNRQYDSVLAAQAAATTQGFRVDERRIEQRLTLITQPQIGWAYVSTIPPTVAQVDAKASYRTEKAVDRLWNQTAPNAGWQNNVASSIVATYAPIFSQEASSFRAPERKQDVTYILQGQPEPTSPPIIFSAAGTIACDWLIPARVLVWGEQEEVELWRLPARGTTWTSSGRGTTWREGARGETWTQRARVLVWIVDVC